jgi:hypothetical protein
MTLPALQLWLHIKWNGRFLYLCYWRREISSYFIPALARPQMIIIVIKLTNFLETDMVRGCENK